MVGFGKMASTGQRLEVRNEIFQLMTEKNKIEAEIKEFFKILSQNHIGMHGPLVDREGFPRNDIDVYQVRTARHKIICLQNDHKNIMLKIEAGLHELHAGTAAETSTDRQSTPETLPEPFAIISMVCVGSPADICGLQENDLVLEFGSVNSSNFKSMQDVAMVVRHSKWQTIRVVVKRKDRHTPLYLDLTPRRWHGQGLIGCKIDPLPVDTVER